LGRGIRDYNVVIYIFGREPGEQSLDVEGRHPWRKP
jgi:hypothetical protein